MAERFYHWAALVALALWIYQWHRAYLLVTAGQWLAGLVQLWCFTSSSASKSPKPECSS